MPRQLSAPVHRALWGRSAGVTEVMLIELDHPDLADPLRVATASLTRLSETPLRYGVISNGVTYESVPIHFRLGDDVAGQATDLRLRVENLNGENLAKLSLVGRVTLRMKLVFSNDPDTISIGPIVQQLDQITANDDFIEGRVAIHPIYDERLVGRVIGPAEAPGLFR